MLKKIIQNFALLFAVSGVILTAQVFAQLDGDPPNICRNGAFPSDSKVYQMARIIGKTGEKIYFYGDEREDCPQGKNCRLKSYIIPGDEIIVSRTLGSYACAWFQPRKGFETVGWINVDNFEWIETNQKPAVSDWIGNWKFYDNSIDIAISKNRGLLGVTGIAFWKGVGDNVHEGGLDDEAAPSGNILKLGEKDTDDYACKVSMQLVGKYLIVSDNMKCGGANVTFSGVYQKKLTK